MGKAKSKRISVRQRNKVEKKVREHHRKVRREGKNAIKQGRVRKTKLTASVIPNNMPGKHELLESLQQQKQIAAEERKAIAQALKANQALKRSNAKVSSMAANVMTAAANTGSEVGFEEPESVNALESSENPKMRQEKYMKELKKVVEEADVLLEVLDARDPLGTRAHAAERAVMEASGGRKRIVLVLNKIDLVPREAALKWLTYLRNELPTYAFCAHGRSHHVGNSAKPGMEEEQRAVVGVDGLLQVLKNYSRESGPDGKSRGTLTVGIIGYPNVGKSSVINALKRSRAAAVGPTPGVTKHLQRFALDRQLFVLDCPGVVLSTDSSGSGENFGSSLVLRNAVRIEALEDPVPHVEAILNRVGPEPLMIWYALPQFANVTEFLALVAKIRGKLRKRGVLELESAARLVLSEWNSGKIPFYSLPPVGPATSQLGARIVSSFAPEFIPEHVDTAMDESVLKFSVNSTQPLQNKTLDVGDFVVVKSTNHAPTFADEKYVEATFSVDITKKRSNSKTQPDSIMMDTDADATRTTPKSNANKKRTKSGKSSAAGLTGVGPGPSDSVNEPFDFSVLNDEN